MSRQTILAEIDSERAHQQQRWGDQADDTINKPNDFVAYISHYATRWFPGGFAPYDAETVADFRRRMIQVASIAVAAVESVDRQGKPFYQK